MGSAPDPTTGVDSEGFRDSSLVDYEGKTNVSGTERQQGTSGIAIR